MKSHEVYAIRRAALRLSKETVAERAGLNVAYVTLFEDGKSIGKAYENKIKTVLNNGFKELNSVEHYKARILELAMEIRNDTSDTSSKENLYRLSHLIVESGKLERELLDNTFTN